MDNERKMAFIEAGVEIESALERFMDNDEMLKKFLKKFMDDKNFEKLFCAMDSKDYEEAFEAAHTLKGVCGNLSLQELNQFVCKEVEYLRAKEYEMAEKYIPELKEAYEEAIEKIKKL